MSPVLAIRIVGVVLAGAMFFHYLGNPWGLVATAALACCVIP